MNTASADVCDLLVVVTQPPRKGHLGQEVFDMTVACGVFDRCVTILLADAGWLHLATDQPSGSEKKALSKLWQSAGLFGIDRVVAPTSIRPQIERITRSQAFPDLELLDDAALSFLLRQAREVVVL